MLFDFDGVIPKDYVGSVCEVKTSENAFITTGKLTSIKSDSIKISMKGKDIASIPFGIKLKVNIFNSKKGFRVVSGKVFTSSKGELCLTEISSIIQQERRKYFRVDMNMPSTAIYKNTFAGKTARADIVIRNISVSGIKFSSRQHFDMGTVLTFSIPINRRKHIDLTCTIIRRGADGVNGYMSYIGRILPDSEKEDAICSFLLQKQGEMMNLNKR